MLKSVTANGSSSGTSFVRHVDIPATIKPENVCIQPLSPAQVQITAGIQLLNPSFPIKNVIATAYVDSYDVVNAKAVVLNDNGVPATGFVTLTSVNNLVISELVFSRTGDNDDPNVLFEYGTIFDDMDDVTLTLGVRDFVNMSANLYTHRVREN